MLRYALFLELVFAAVTFGYGGVMVVDQLGSDGSSFSSIQDAIDAVPVNNDNWVRIVARAGTYREQVVIPSTKPYIILQGEGMADTQVVWHRHDDISLPTFRSSADNVVVIDITFVNSYNYPIEDNTNSIAPAVAALIEGDKSAFYRCGFLGYQDTLYDAQGRHYYYSCSMLGSTDFIFGHARSLYDNCVLTVAPLPDGLPGYITAQSRSRPDENSGFVFKKCQVTGGPTYLGRAWGPYALVVYYQTTFYNTIAPPGWSSWHYSGKEGQLTFAEEENVGEGLSMEGRVAWEKKLSPDEAARYASLDFIGTWLDDQPKPPPP